VQKIELLVVVCAVAVIVVGSIVQGNYFSQLLSIQVQLTIGFITGLIASFVVLVDRVDLVPDTLERPIAIASVGVAGGAWTVMSAWRRRRAFSRPRPPRRVAEYRSSASSNGSPNDPLR
jgi:hypothetical protein